MQKNDRWPEDYDPASTSSSRRNSASSRRNSLKKEKEREKKKSPLNSSISSANSTPKKVARTQQNFDLVVTGKQLLKKGDRANSLPGGYQRRPSADSASRRRAEVKRSTQVAKSRENSLEDTESLDLSQVSDFEDTLSKYGIPKMAVLATSTPKPRLGQKPRSASVNQPNSRVDRLKSDSSRSRESTHSDSRDSLYYKTSSTTSNRTFSRHGVSTELDYSSVSPEYSGQSSASLSPGLSPSSDRSQELYVSSRCISTCDDCTEAERTKVPELAEGEWSRFWQQYNLGLTGPRRYYDQCPTPYRNDTFDVTDLDLSESSRKRSPDNITNINSIIRNEGLHLTPRETQNIIKCAHILGNVLTKAIERRSKEKDDNPTKIEEIRPEKHEKPENLDPEFEMKKKTMTLDLKETNVPLDVNEIKRCETATTQTDISLPNTKSAPRIFESILRQLSRTTIEEKIEKEVENKKESEKPEVANHKVEENPAISMDVKIEENTL